MSSEVEKKKEKEKKLKEKTQQNVTGIIEEFDPYAKSWHGSQYGLSLMHI